MKIIKKFNKNPYLIFVIMVHDLYTGLNTVIVSPINPVLDTILRIVSMSAIVLLYLSITKEIKKSKKEFETNLQTTKAEFETNLQTTKAEFETNLQSTKAEFETNLQEINYNVEDNRRSAMKRMDDHIDQIKNIEVELKNYKKQ